MVSQKLTYHKRSGKTHFSVHSEIRFDWLTSCSIREQLVVYGTPFSRDWLPSHVPCAVFYRSHARVWSKRRRAGAGGLWFWFVWFAVRVFFGLCGFPFVCFPLSMAFSVAYNAFLKVSSQTFFEGVAWSSDRQKGKFFPFETLYLKIIRELSRFFCSIFGNGCKFR